ncbi:MAG: TRAP transporter large permease subunit [Desulfobacterales bacterium]
MSRQPDTSDGGCDQSPFRSTLSAVAPRCGGPGGYTESSYNQKLRKRDGPHSTTGGDVVADVLIGSGLNRWIVLIIMMSIVFLLGIFNAWAAILLATFPIFMPIAMELDFNPLRVSILMGVNLQTSFLTPPFGYALLPFRGVAPEG